MSMFADMFFISQSTQIMKTGRGGFVQEVIQVTVSLTWILPSSSEPQWSDMDNPWS